jgi:hypothetical protein
MHAAVPAAVAAPCCRRRRVRRARPWCFFYARRGGDQAGGAARRSRPSCCRGVLELGRCGGAAADRRRRGRSTGARARLRHEGSIWASWARSGPHGPDLGGRSQQLRIGAWRRAGGPAPPAWPGCRRRGASGSLGVASSRLVREMNGAEWSREVCRPWRQGLRGRCGGWLVFQV